MGEIEADNGSLIHRRHQRCMYRDVERPKTLAGGKSAGSDLISSVEVVALMSGV